MLSPLPWKVPLKAKCERRSGVRICYQLLILTSLLTSSLRLFLTSYAWLLIMFSLAKLSHDAVASARSLKSLKSAFQALVLFNDYLCHLLVSPPDVLKLLQS